MKIELVYFNGCPNIDAARNSIKKACEQLGLKSEWKEWNQSEDDVPDHLRAFGSPSVLVNGIDVAGGPGECCQEKSCRLYEGNENAPNVDLIKTALQARLTP